MSSSSSASNDEAVQWAWEQEIIYEIHFVEAPHLRLKWGNNQRRGPLSVSISANIKNVPIRHALLRTEP